MNITIRYPSINDIPVLAEMWLQLIMEEHPDAKPNIEEWSEMMKRMMESPSYLIAVVEVDKKPVGFHSGMVCNDVVFGGKYIEGQFFYVYPEYRGKGPAKILHRDTHRICREMNIKFVRRHITKEHLPFVLEKGHRVVEFIVDEQIKEN